MNMKKIIPFIPIIGIPLTFIIGAEETGIDVDDRLFFGSAFVQGVSLFILILSLGII